MVKNSLSFAKNLPRQPVEEILMMIHPFKKLKGLQICMNSNPKTQTTQKIIDEIHKKFFEMDRYEEIKKLHFWKLFSLSYSSRKKFSSFISNFNMEKLEEIQFNVESTSCTDVFDYNLEILLMNIKKILTL